MSTLSQVHRKQFDIGDWSGILVGSSGQTPPSNWANGWLSGTLTRKFVRFQGKCSAFWFVLHHYFLVALSLCSLELRIDYYVAAL